MTYAISIVFDCSDVEKVSRFWLAALKGYNYPGGDPAGPAGSPPPGYTSWESWADAHHIPEHLRHQSRTIIDTTGERPDIFFMAVPEEKATKNRVHLDIRVARTVAPEDARDRQDTEAKRLVAAGATLLRRVENGDGTSHLIMLDVEGNEFCIT